MMEGVRLRHSFLREREKESPSTRRWQMVFFAALPVFAFFCAGSPSPSPPLCGCQTKQKPLYVYLALSCYSSRRRWWLLHARLTPSSSSLSRRTKAGFSVAKALLPLQLPGTAFADDREKKSHMLYCAHKATSPAISQKNGTFPLPNGQIPPQRAWMRRASTLYHGGGSGERG